VTPLPLILRCLHAEGARTFELALSPDLPQFSGHFPGIPILPAVAQIDWAIRLARAHFAPPARFEGLRALKFTRVVQPPEPLTLELKVHPSGRAIEFAYVQSGAPCSSGRIEFTDEAGAGRTVL
jgi:3-hydroxymyristoyl/3-hydroxydecanoyl-(acyl carrier protein) dehydratase